MDIVDALVRAVNAFLFVRHVPLLRPISSALAYGPASGRAPRGSAFRGYRISIAPQATPATTPPNVTSAMMLFADSAHAMDGNGVPIHRLPTK